MKIVIAVIFMLFCIPAFAWNCSQSGQVRVQVPTGTVGNGVGDGPGQVVVDNGLTFECMTLPTADPKSPVTSSSTSNSSSNSSANANSNSSSTSSSNQNQGQKQKQDQSQSSTNNNQSAGGSVSDVGNSQTLVEAPKIPVNSAYAPTTIPSAPCVKGFGAGVQTMPIGGSFGGNKIDEGCDARETARAFALLGSRVAACKVMINTKQSKKAGVTMDDCLHVVVTPAPVVQVTQPQPIVVVPVVPVNVILPQPAEYKTEMTVVAPKPVVKKKIRHLPPNCQNVVQKVCKENKNGQ